MSPETLSQKLIDYACVVSLLNPQVGANGIENLAQVCKGKVCVDLDLNLQMFSFWEPAEPDNCLMNWC